MHNLHSRALVNNKPCVKLHVFLLCYPFSLGRAAPVYPPPVLFCGPHGPPPLQIHQINLWAS